MANFLTTKAIAFQLEEIIKAAKDNLYIITPYLRLSPIFYERLSDATEKGIDITFVYGKTELSKEDRELLFDLNINIYFKKNLHAKCYMNESSALITSMNLHTFSESNNREIGILTKKSEDREVYTDCLDEIISIIRSSKIEKIQSKADSSISFSEPSFMENLLLKIKTKHPSLQYNTDEESIVVENFYKPYIKFSIHNSTVPCFEIQKNGAKVDDIQKKHEKQLQKTFSSYRLFWNKRYKYHKIYLYPAENKQYENEEEKLSYISNGLILLSEEIKNIFV